MDSSTVICWTSPFVILGASGLFLSLLFHFFMENSVGNNVDPDQMPHHVASDLGLQNLSMILLRVSR